MAVDILQGLLTQHPQQFFPIGTKASPIVPEVPEYQMPAPQSGTDMVNGSVAEEAVAEASRAAEQEAQQRQATQNAIQRGLLETAAREDTARQDPAILNRFQRNLVQGLVDSKALYDAAKDDAVRQQISAGANSIRNIAGRMGVDVGDYGADVPYADAAQRLALNDARALYDVLYNSKTSDDYYMDAYNKILDAGGYEGTAREVAGEAARKYQAEQTKKLRDAFLTYGMDGRGVINPNGEVLLGMMANENPALAEILAKTNPMPVQNWNFENGLITANEGFKRDLQKMGEQFAQRDKERREGFQHDFQKAAYLSDLETKKALTIKQGYAQIDQMVKNMDRDRANAEAYKQCLVLAGGDEATAQQLFAQYSLKAGMWGRGSAGGSRAGGSRPASDGSMKISDANTIINQHQKWMEDHPDESPEASPFKDGYDNAVAAMNGYSDAPLDPDNADSVTSWATKILEENYRRGYPLNEEQLHKVISSAGGYGPKVADMLKEEGMLSGEGGYGKRG